MKSFVKFFFIISLVLTSSGCWNNRDLTDLAIMTGIAFDKSADGNIEMTAQIIKPEVMKPAGEGSGSEKKAYTNVTSTGETVFECARNLLSKLNNKAYFAQVQLIVISEEAAKENLSKYFDLFERDIETRRRAYLLITKDMKAKTVLESQSQLTDLSVTHEVEALEASTAFGKTVKVTLIDVLKDFDNENFAVVLPILHPNKQTNKTSHQNLILEGSAVIKRDTLVGFLDPMQTRGFLFANDEIKSTIINVSSSISSDKKVSIEIISSKGKTKAEIINGKPVLNIQIKAEGNIGEQQEKDDLTKPYTIETLEKEVQKTIRSEIQDAVKITKEEYHSDVFGFIDDIYRNYYPQWTKIKSSWSKIYSSTPVNVTVEFKLRKTGLIKEPAKPE